MSTEIVDILESEQDATSLYETALESAVCRQLFPSENEKLHTQARRHLFTALFVDIIIKRTE
jgi:hypothetical protein